MFVFNHVMLWSIVFYIFSCAAMNLQQYNLTLDEIATLKKFGITHNGKGDEYSLTNYFCFTINSADGTPLTLNTRYFSNLYKESSKIQYIVRESCRHYVSLKLENEEEHVKAIAHKAFVGGFNFYAPDAHNFSANSLINRWSSLDTCLAGTISIMFIGTLYSFLMQDHKSFNGTLEGAVGFAFLALLYGWVTGK